MLVAGFAGLVAGACSMAIGEFVSVYSQLDTEIAQLNRAEGRKDATVGQAAVGDMRQLPSPVQLRWRRRWRLGRRGGAAARRWVHNATK
ncbi:Vacuolar iron transporter [Ananas comosus]|uniref:Vacuolar iron transporter n=1 Tax=Ananas comosus TaxID=4615 RepID=A0A199W4Q6_ANACO|nr:Vacuolar iron transporter [Ananas comosus]